MGASASVNVATADAGQLSISLKQLPEAIEESLYVMEKFPLIIDPTESASRFLKYQMGSFINADDPVNFTKRTLNRSLVGALQFGRTMTLKFKTLEGLDESAFEDGIFPKEVIARQRFYADEIWQSVIKPDLGDTDPSEITISQDFAFIICTVADFVPAELAKAMRIIRVDDKRPVAAEDGTVQNAENDFMEQVASLYGAAEVVRYVLHMVNTVSNDD